MLTFNLPHNDAELTSRCINDIIKETQNYKIKLRNIDCIERMAEEMRKIRPPKGICEEMFKVTSLYLIIVELIN